MEFSWFGIQIGLVAGKKNKDLIFFCYIYSVAYFHTKTPKNGELIEWHRESPVLLMIAVK